MFPKTQAICSTSSSIVQATSSLIIVVSGSYCKRLVLAVIGINSAAYVAVSIFPRLSSITHIIMESVFMIVMGEAISDT